MGDSPEDTEGLPWLDGGESDEAEVEARQSSAELEAAGQSSMFGEAPDQGPEKEGEGNSVSAPEVARSPEAMPPSDAAQPYRVLARKYRPQTFSQLIGQEPMVRTLANAIKRDRLAHAFLMTGVRGVGKTSTARLIAKALNCIGADGKGGPTIDPCGVCEPCRAIAEGRHIDVIEMDAASHTGVDDVREIIEAVRYAAVSARYKIYIIDEVHMLSRNAFNALLKTLEEPPAHVKFLFATTEVDKLPVTVLSRTQRFDLRRIPTEQLTQHFAEICAQEQVEAQDEALWIVASAAEGSVRDGLSILDQAIAHADLDGAGGSGHPLITAERVRDMLGLADKGAQRRLLGHILSGDPVALLKATDDQYALGVEPLALVRSVMELVHRVTVVQVTGEDADAPSSEERDALGDWSQRLSAGQLHRLWQLLLKGHDEVRTAPDPLAALKMALLRALHASDLPDPGQLAKRIEELASSAPSPVVSDGTTTAPGAERTSHAADTPTLDWSALVDKVEAAGQHLAASIMRLQVRPVTLEPELLRFSRSSEYNDAIEPVLREALFAVTDKRWIIEQIPDTGERFSIAEREEIAHRGNEKESREHPLSVAALAAFPDAEWVEPAASGGSAAKTQWRRNA